MPTILIVDDEAIIRTLVRLTLEPQGYDVVEAAEGVEALALAEAHQPDLALLDIALPHLSGLEVARRLGDRTPVLFLTGLAPEADAVDGRGVRGSIEKPFSPAALLRRIEETLASAA
jgi:DNA-binding response OmpR family regulator